MRRTRHSTGVRAGCVDAPADRELMRLVAGGDARAFEAVFDRHADAAFSLAHRMSGRQAAAEAIVEAAFLSLWRTGARYDPAIGDVRTWILRAVHQAGIAALRREAAGTAPGRGGGGGGGGAPAPGSAPPLTRHALEQLPSEQRRVIELAYFDGLTHGDIARLLELPEVTVKEHMARGLATLNSLRDPK